MGLVEKISGFAGKTFTLWVIIFAIIAYIMPNHFIWIGDYIVPLLGIVMFGMGLTLSAADFKEVFRRPKRSSTRGSRTLYHYAIISVCISNRVRFTERSGCWCYFGRMLP